MLISDAAKVCSEPTGSDGSATSVRVGSGAAEVSARGAGAEFAAGAAGAGADAGASAGFGFDRDPKIEGTRDTPGIDGTFGRLLLAADTSAAHRPATATIRPKRANATE